MSPGQERRLEVRRDDIHVCRVREERLTPLEDRQALFAVDRFALTANNLTYALLGQRLDYWRLFPAPEGWGQIPVWGYLRVLDHGSSTGSRPGRCAYGFCPPSSHAVLTPARMGGAGFVEAAPHRAALDPVYNSYSWLESDDVHDPTIADRLLVLRPLFWLSFMLDDYLSTEGLSDGRTVLITSASSKSAIGAALLLAEHGVRVIGLTSTVNARFVAGLDVYYEVVPYEEVGELPRTPALLLDLAGSGAVRNEIGDRFGELLAHTVIAGGTHRDAEGADTAPADAHTSFMFVPRRIRRLAREIGWPALNRRYLTALHRFAEHAGGWLQIRHASGPEEVEAAYRRTLENAVRPNQAHVLTLADDGTGSGCSS